MSADGYSGRAESGSGADAVTPGKAAAVEATYPISIHVAASDGYVLGGFIWGGSDDKSSRRPVVIVNPATSVRCRYYFKFAQFLHEHGFIVVAFDYRGIGESRPASLRNFDATYTDWGRLDFEAILVYVANRFPGQSIDVAAHSIGGFLLGLAPSNNLIRRVFTMGAQYAYWKDFAPNRRLLMVLKWFVFMPIVTKLFGYFPGSRFGWIEDTPKGVVKQWSMFSRSFENPVWKATKRSGEHSPMPFGETFGSLQAPILAMSVTDDEWGTSSAINRLLGHFENCRKYHLRIPPAAINEPAIGHFAFFQKRYEPTLWPIPLAWLQSGTMPALFSPYLEREQRAATDVSPTDDELKTPAPL